MREGNDLLAPADEDSMVRREGRLSRPLYPRRELSLNKVKKPAKGSKKKPKPFSIERPLNFSWNFTTPSTVTDLRTAFSSSHSLKVVTWTSTVPSLRT
ncbi:hypothetical protein GGTG_13854 [Gaeumannomyces tritici R3-111a-1]|uniref:Uncharacterized protein n=1 Tax=Gaeumannomyces tritici (strain R3-111a-1) TaxID=644352 RepID=J3PK09_GAET3|nr:hypothetical protein GGTG_13854 [Gaeumannomyces tritici R3-111a-1]EJT68568.1 hypothetical protein GGTG_13854 [Gaeumannomyces tritici R3-111a-1]